MAFAETELMGGAARIVVLYSLISWCTFGLRGSWYVTEIVVAQMELIADVSWILVLYSVIYRCTLSSNIEKKV